METPYFKISEMILEQNIVEFRDALLNNWPNSIFGYSVKTNSLPGLLQHIRSYGIFAEVVSDEEYELAMLCGCPENTIIFNGPIKSEKYLLRAITNGAIINIDSWHEIESIRRNKPTQYGNIGVRVNVDTERFLDEDIGYKEDGFRFGFSSDSGELSEIIKILSRLYGRESFGLHFHCNSRTRDLRVYQAIAEYAVHIIDQYKLSPTFLNIGGGFFGGVEGKPSADAYISTISNVLNQAVDQNRTKLIIEPGSALIGSAIDYYTTVLDVKTIKLNRFVTIDGSRVHIDPLWNKTKYMYSCGNSYQKVFSGNQIICGYTCMDHDRIMAVVNGPEIAIGDSIIFHRVGAYTITFGGPFIQFLPEVFFQKSDTIERLRKRMDVEQYFQIQT